jgi:hypothetical protein
VARAHKPFVFPEWDVGPPDEEYKRVWGVRLNNEGPGIALDVRWSIAVPEGPSREDRTREEHQSRALASEAIRALRPGQGTDWLAKSIHESVTGDIWYLLVRYTDSAGTRWEYFEPGNPQELARPVRRLRRVRPYRPVRRALSLRESPDW